MILDINFESSDDGVCVPKHTREALQNYILKGYQPGGFLSAMISNDLFSAVNSADVVNRHYMYSIARWIITDMPFCAKGSYGQMKEWIEDKNQCRSAWVESYRKERAVDVLKGEYPND